MDDVIAGSNPVTRVHEIVNDACAAWGDDFLSALSIYNDAQDGALLDELASFCMHGHSRFFKGAKRLGDDDSMSCV